MHVYRQHPMFLSQSHMYTFPRIQATTPTVLNVISSTSDNDRDVIDNINSSNVDVNIDNAPGTGSKGAQLGKANL